jgi:SAM-dependent methyltransferase
MISDPAKYWQGVSAQLDWRDHILPHRSKTDFDTEGYLEAQRLFYFVDKYSLVIDYGCGIGRVLQYIAERAAFVIGLDICSNFLTRASELIKRENVAFFRSDEYSKENVADLVYSLMVLQHNDKANRIKIISHIFKLLKFGGVAIISFPRYESNYYRETETLHKFKIDEVIEYAQMFRYARIIEGNLAGYEKGCDKNINHEYYLIAVK